VINPLRHYVFKCKN